MELHSNPGHLTVAALRRVYQEPVRLTLDAGAADAIDASVATVERLIAEGRTVYGINTGFGLLASTKIAREDLIAHLERHGFRLAREHTFLPYPYFLVFELR